MAEIKFPDMRMIEINRAMQIIAKPSSEINKSCLDVKFSSRTDVYGKYRVQAIVTRFSVVQSGQYRDVEEILNEVACKLHSYVGKRYSMPPSSVQIEENHPEHNLVMSFIFRPEKLLPQDQVNPIMVGFEESLTPQEIEEVKEVLAQRQRVERGLSSAEPMGTSSNPMQWAKDNLPDRYTEFTISTRQEKLHNGEILQIKEILTTRVPGELDARIMDKLLVGLDRQYLYIICANKFFEYDRIASNDIDSSGIAFCYRDGWGFEEQRRWGGYVEWRVSKNLQDAVRDLVPWVTA